MLVLVRVSTATFRKDNAGKPRHRNQQSYTTVVAQVSNVIGVVRVPVSFWNTVREATVVSKRKPVE